MPAQAATPTREDPAMTRQVKVSGKTFYAALDPAATGVPEQSGWPEPTSRRVGRGRSFAYELTDEQALDMWSHLATLAACFNFATTGSHESASEGRAIARDIERNEWSA